MNEQYQKGFTAGREYDQKQITKYLEEFPDATVIDYYTDHILII